MYPSQRIIPKGNVAAVEPYIHLPHQKPITLTNNKQHKQMPQQNLIQDLANLKLDTCNINNQKNANNALNGNTNVNVNQMQFSESDENKLTRQILHMKQHSLDFDTTHASTDITDFVASNKCESKFQTLPYGTATAKAASLYHAKSNASATKSILSTTMATKSISSKESIDTESPTYKYHGSECDSSNMRYDSEINGSRSHSQLPMVQSVASSAINDSIATSMGNSSCTAANSNNRTDEILASHTKPATTHQIVSGNIVVPPRKPISSVAPTTVTHTSKSILPTPRVHAVAPNIINTYDNNDNISSDNDTNNNNNNNNNGINRDDDNINNNMHMHNIGINTNGEHKIGYNHNDTATINGLSELFDKSRPALPPKPNKGSDSNSSTESSPQSSGSSNGMFSSTKIRSSNIPTIIGASEKLYADLSQQSMVNSGNTPNIDNFPIKAKPLTIKKQPLSEQPRLRSQMSGIKPIQYTSRRIEMPSELLFPELEKVKTKAMEESRIPSVARIENKSSITSSSSSSIDDTDKSANSSVSSEVEKTNALQNGDVPRRQRSALSESGVKTKLTRRVSFDPLALLLDASLEGELELVQKTAMQVK